MGERNHSPSAGVDKAESRTRYLQSKGMIQAPSSLLAMLAAQLQPKEGKKK